MPLLIPEGFAEIAIQLAGEGDPDPWYTTFGVETGDGGGDIDAIGKRACQAFGTTLLTQLPPQVTMLGCKVTLGSDDEPIRQFVSPPTGSWAGSSNVAKLPQNCAVLIRKNTLLGGRRNRGRMFIPAMATEGSVDLVGRIAGDVRDAYQVKADDFLTDLTSGGAFSLTMHVLHNSDGLSTAGPPTEVTSLSVDPVISTQRRRLR